MWYDIKTDSNTARRDGIIMTHKISCTDENGGFTIYISGRIDSNDHAAAESELFELLGRHKGQVPVLDLSGLEYISSAGLRVLMKIRKACGEPLEFINTSPDVYDIFETTGFTELFKVSRKLREISIDGLPLIGAGANGKVYRIDSERIVKVYEPLTNPFEKILREKESARQAFIHDIPSAISYDVVRVGGRYGIVYEMIDAVTLGHYVSQHPDELSACAVKMADLLKKLHSTSFDENTLPDARVNLHLWADVAEKSGRYQPDTIAVLREVIDSIPYRNTFIHGDYHLGNIMVRDDEWLLIDMGDASLGHPVDDLLGAYQIMRLVASRPGGAERYMGAPGEMIGRFWDIFIRRYFETDDSSLIEKSEDILRYYAMIRSLAGVTFSDVVPDDVKAKLSAKVQAAFLEDHSRYGTSAISQLPF